MSLSPLDRAVDEPWYEAFLEPVLDQLAGLSQGSRVLDIGSGPGRLLELVSQKLDMFATGVDVDREMLIRAGKRLGRTQTPLILSRDGQPLPFADDTFDAACLCSVLFLLDDPKPLVDEAVRVLKPHRELVVLTPTGVGDPSAAVAALPAGSNGRLRNAMVHVWHRASGGRGRTWVGDRWLEQYAATGNYRYTKSTVFRGLAVLEVVQI